MADAKTRRVVRLEQLAPGAKFKVYPRAKFRWAKKWLADSTLEVVEHSGGVTWVKVSDREAPLWPGLRVLL